MDTRNSRYTVRASDIANLTIVELHGDTRDAALGAAREVVAAMATGRIARVESYREERLAGTWRRQD